MQWNTEPELRYSLTHVHAGRKTALIDSSRKDLPDISGPDGLLGMVLLLPRSVSVV